ncbi:MAG: hypothetical protein QW594_04100 [Candidatus Woesearchaeota archaeon]
MSLESVKKEVIKEGERKVAAINAETAQHLATMQKEAEEEIAAYKKEAQKKLEKEIEELRKREEAQAELEANKILQEAKRACIEAVYQDLIQMLQAQPQKEREAMLKQLLQEAKKEIAIGSVWVSPADVPLLKGMTNVKSKPLLGGLIAESVDGTVLLDYSYDQMVEQLQEKMLAQVSQLLFS